MSDRKEYFKKYRLTHKENYRKYQEKYRENHLSTYEKMKQENQQLKDRDLIIALEFEKVQIENEQLKTRIEKAIKYIRKNRIVNTIFQEHEEELIEILKD